MGKRVWVWVIVIVVVALLVWRLPGWLGKSWGELNLTGPTPSPTPSPYSGKKAVPVAGQSYEQVLLAYMDKRIQFNDKCQGIPGQMVLKNGTKIMLDNRSKYTQTVNLDGTKIVLPGYSWQLVTISTKNKLPYNFGIDCKSEGGTTENGAVINLQALIGL